jgi:hypothetical protein
VTRGETIAIPSVKVGHGAVRREASREATILEVLEVAILRLEGFDAEPNDFHARGN